MAEPVYAVGDIHGQLEKLEEVLSWIDADGGKDAQIVFLGDLVDRGPDSQGVIDRLIAGQAAGRDWIVLLGNHDRMFRMFLESPPRHDPHLLIDYTWLHPALGGIETLASYGVEAHGRRRLEDVHREAIIAVPEAHQAFLHRLHTKHVVCDLFFAHAGIRPGVPLAEQTEDDLVWIRKEFHVHTDLHPALIVHGHTPVEAPTHYGNRVNLDSGAGYGKALTAAVFEDAQVWTLGTNGRTILAPER